MIWYASARPFVLRGGGDGGLTEIKKTDSKKRKKAGSLPSGSTDLGGARAHTHGISDATIIILYVFPRTRLGSRAHA